jgi:hypothetical protein
MSRRRPKRIFTKTAGASFLVGITLFFNGCGLADEVSGVPTSEDHKANLERWITADIPKEVRKFYGPRFVSDVKAKGTSCIQTRENEFECATWFSYLNRITGSRQNDGWSYKATCDDTGECIWRGV